MPNRSRSIFPFESPYHPAFAFAASLGARGSFHCIAVCRSLRKTEMHALVLHLGASGRPELGKNTRTERCSGRLSLGHTDAFDIAVKQGLHVAGTLLGAEPEPSEPREAFPQNVQTPSHLGLRSMPRQHLSLQIRRQGFHSLRPRFVL